jgi:acetate kinase
MADSILVLNAGSSSLKFSVFRDQEPPEPVLRGQVECLLTLPRLVAHDAQGRIVGDKAWEAEHTLDQADAIQFPFDWGRRNEELMIAKHTRRLLGAPSKNRKGHS